MTQRRRVAALVTLACLLVGAPGEAKKKWKRPRPAPTRPTPSKGGPSYVDPLADEPSEPEGGGATVAPRPAPPRETAPPSPGSTPDAANAGAAARKAPSLPGEPPPSAAAAPAPESGGPPAGAPPPGGPPPGGPPPGAPKGPPNQYVPPWMAALKIPELTWPWGHIGYDLNYVKGLWHASESFPPDRGFHLGLGPDDRFLLILNLSLALRFIEVHNGLTERGRSFAVERLVLNIRGNFMTPRLVYMINILALTSLGSTPFLLDVMMGWAVVPRKFALLGGQMPTDVIPQATTVVTHYQLTDRSLATKFFWVDRSIGVAANITPSNDPMNQVTIQAGVWNRTIEQGPLSYNQYNPDLRFMYTLGFDYNNGPNYGVREGDFPWSTRARMRLSLRAMYADVDTPRAGQVALKGRIVFGHVNWGIKARGFSAFAGGFVRWSQFIDRDPDLFDVGMHAQIGVFVKKHMVELVARYAQIWPDMKYHDGPPRNLPTTSLLQPKVDILEPIVGAATWEAGGGIRLFPTKDPMFNIIAVYLYRNIDSAFILQVNGWI